MKKIFRRLLVGKRQDFSFRAFHEEKFILPKLEKVDLYVHIPFCHSLCPYCPYNRMQYKEDLANHYLQALLGEIDLYYEKLGKINVSSLYFGGGTPTTMGCLLEIITRHVRKRFFFEGKIALETSISEINEQTIEYLKSVGVNLLSVGVQSFQDKYLKMLKRNYKSEDIYSALNLLKEARFESVNLDLIFSYPGETKEELLYDLGEAIKSGADQYTIYPLFVFSHSEAGKALSLKGARLPHFFKRKRLYHAIDEFFNEHELEKVSVWGYRRKGKAIYSSVTRNNYVGFGAGAGTNVRGVFYFNTFSVKEYIDRLVERRFPIAVEMKKSDRLDDVYWLYWRLYETRISKRALYEIFGKKVIVFLWLFKVFGFYKEEEDVLTLTHRGAFWIHLAQNSFIIHYIDRVWTVLKQNPWPKRINF